jgi:16S rRNA (uracil1498-N3)-methyltransferase
MMRVLIQRGGCPPAGWEAGKRVSLDDNEVHHLRVRRARDRESVEILDGAGLSGTGLLIRTGSQWLVEVRAAERREPPPETVLAVAAGDRERFSWMVEKSVELGVTRVIPLETARSAAVASRLKDVHLRRLRRLALEAIKQCGATWAPAVDEPVPLAEFVRRPAAGTLWLADPAGPAAPTTLNHGSLTVVVGPEGGFTDSERGTLGAAGYQPIALGPHTLRFETAALAAAAAATQARMRGQHG